MREKYDFIQDHGFQVLQINPSLSVSKSILVVPLVQVIISLLFPYGKLYMPYYWLVQQQLFFEFKISYLLYEL